MGIQLPDTLTHKPWQSGETISGRLIAHLDRTGRELVAFGLPEELHQHVAGEEGQRRQSDHGARADHASQGTTQEWTERIAEREGAAGNPECCTAITGRDERTERGIRPRVQTAGEDTRDTAQADQWADPGDQGLQADHHAATCGGPA